MNSNNGRYHRPAASPTGALPKRIGRWTIRVYARTDGLTVGTGRRVFVGTSREASAEVMRLRKTFPSDYFGIDCVWKGKVN
jgi:hypothetical protein